MPAATFGRVCFPVWARPTRWVGAKPDDQRDAKRRIREQYLQTPASRPEAVPPAKKKERPKALSLLLVPASRLELLRLVATTPSRWRVYQFHHAGLSRNFQPNPDGACRQRDGSAGVAGAAGVCGAGAGAVALAAAGLRSSTERLSCTILISMTRLVTMKPAASQ